MEELWRIFRGRSLDEKGMTLAWAQSGHEGSPSWPGAAVRDRDRICVCLYLYGGVDARTSRTSDVWPWLASGGSDHQVEREKEC